MPQLPDLEAWAIFAKVADSGSFSRAAGELGLAKTTVSKAVSRLERRMRTTLFHRTTRKLSLTETGRHALERAARILADGRAIEADVLEEAEVPRGPIRVSVLAAFGQAALAPVLPRFLTAYPGIELDLVLNEHPVDLVMQGFDLAVQIGSGGDSSMRASRLYSMAMPLTAAPSLVERLGMPAHARDLSRYPALIGSHLPHPEELLLDGPDGESCLVRLNGVLRVNSSVMLVPALVAGLGIATLPEIFLRRHVEAGALVPLLPAWRTTGSNVYVVTPPGRARPARVGLFIDFLRTYFAGSPFVPDD